MSITEEQRTTTSLETLALQGRLPPLDWHVNNCVQILHHLRGLNAPHPELFSWRVDSLNILYQSYANSYDKLIRKQFLSALRALALELADSIKSMEWEAYFKECIAPWEITHAGALATGRNYYSFEQYTKRCRDLFCALHDFALGTNAVCIVTDAEPYKDIYNELEKQT